MTTDFHTPQPPALTSLGGLVHPGAVGADVETFRFDRGLQAPPIVCVQWGKTDGSHAVEITRRVRDALAGMLEAPQLWWHNGMFDSATILEWYPELAPRVWRALEDGRWLDTMVLQRMIQIARGDMGGPLALDMVSLQWGLPPPTKEITATLNGVDYDVRTSFGLWYGAEEIPDPWHSYADYDGIIMLPLAKRQTERWCMPQPGQSHPAVRMEDLAFVTRFYFGLNLTHVYGIAVDPTNTAALARAAHAAIGRLKEVAIQNGYLKPVKATRIEAKAGAAAAARFCPVQLERRPKAASKVPGWERRQAKHANCPGCQLQATAHAVATRKEKQRAKKEERPPVIVPITPESNAAAWSLDVARLETHITAAYEGKPPLTEPKKGKGGKRTGGGTIARSRDALQDSGDAKLMAFSEYNEWSTVVHKDLVMFEHSPVHQTIRITNNLRPSSSNPNMLNLRRNGFVIASCPCGFETSWDKEEHNAWKKSGKTMACPACGK